MFCTLKFSACVAHLDCGLALFSRSGIDISHASSDMPQGLVLQQARCFEIFIFKQNKTKPSVFPSISLIDRRHINYYKYNTFANDLHVDP